MQTASCLGECLRRLCLGACKATAPQSYKREQAVIYGVDLRGLAYAVFLSLITAFVQYLIIECLVEEIIIALVWYLIITHSVE